MFAIIKTGGKQIKVEPGQEIFIEKIDGEINQKVIFDEILMIDGKVGSPTIEGARVSGVIIKQGKGKKIRVIRYHPKKNVNKVYGHRQPYTKVKIDEITTKASEVKAKVSVEKPANSKAKKSTKSTKVNE